MKSLYEVETINQYGGTDFFCGEFETFEEAVESFRESLSKDGYTIKKIYQIIGKGQSESALNL